MRRLLRRKTSFLYIFAVSLALYVFNGSAHRSIDAWFPFLSTNLNRNLRWNSDEFNIFYHLGGNGPWIAKANALGHADDPLPDGCAVDQVHMLSRHAERYPTQNAGNRHIELLKRLHGWDVTLRGSLTFLKTWTYFADEKNPPFDMLTRDGPHAGVVQARITGKELRRRYGHLVPKDRVTRFWSCETPRDVETARNFAYKFFGYNWERDGTAELVVIPETIERGADTLTPGDTCKRYLTDAYGHDYGYYQLKIWQQTFAPPIVKRLYEHVTGVELTPQDIYSMMEMCGFEILVRGSSPWCDVFTHEEWLQFEYARDLLHFYRAGPGNQFAPAMGWLWLNATAELLSNQVSKDVYFSFVHDGDIVPLLAALQIYDEKSLVQELPVDFVKENRIWRTSDVVPMSGRVIFERVACRSSPVDSTQRRYVRILINDGLVKMRGIQSSKEVPHAIPLTDFRKYVDSRLDLFGDFKTVCDLSDDVPQRITFLHQPGRE